MDVNCWNALYHLGMLSSASAPRLDLHWTQGKGGVNFNSLARSPNMEAGVSTNISFFGFPLRLVFSLQLQVPLTMLKVESRGKWVLLRLQPYFNFVNSNFPRSVFGSILHRYHSYIQTLLCKKKKAVKGSTCVSSFCIRMCKGGGCWQPLSGSHPHYISWVFRSSILK